MDNVAEELRGLLLDVAEIEDEIKALEYSVKEKKERIHQIVSASDSKSITIDGVATALITKDSTTVSYDKDGLDSLIAQLVKDGEVHTAQRISDLRSESKRKGHLMIRKPKY